ncbi:MAG: AAA family ATPase [Lachnospiraceae bacterium]|nr:AAA family ATPase [Lachnospiraceae bacterium]
MKLSKRKLYNFRCVGDVEQVIDIDNITAFIENNSTGKTAVLLALNGLFSNI